ncbi:hypothetical protein V502_02284, partial [Pseudogymnoascus sp. VKM F-4520 (FW-2644)]
MSDPDTLVAADPMNKWFKARHFQNGQGRQAERWYIRKGLFALNPEFSNSIDFNIRIAFPLLPALVKTYIAIDRLNSTETTNSALTESLRVIDAHIPAEKTKLPQEIVDGIYVRVELLQNWIKSQPNAVRARQDYKEWKKKQDASPQSSQVRNRRGYRLDGTTTIAPPTTPFTPLSTLSSPNRSPKLLSMKFHLQGDITIWTLILLIYFPSTILQTLSFSRSLPSSPSSSEFLTAIQTTFTQLFSVIMTYALTIRNDRGCRLSMAYRMRFGVTSVLPVVALGVVRWDKGVSELVGVFGDGCDGGFAGVVGGAYEEVLGVALSLLSTTLSTPFKDLLPATMGRKALSKQDHIDLAKKRGYFVQSSAEQQKVKAQTEQRSLTDATKNKHVEVANIFQEFLAVKGLEKAPLQHDSNLYKDFVEYYA